MEKLLIVANWKANKTVEEAKEWVKQLTDYRPASPAGGLPTTAFEKIEIAIAAPYTLIPFVKYILTTVHQSLITNVASQDLSMYAPGQYTGEVPAELLKDLGVAYCLVGHSERRKYFKETNIEAGAKLGRLLQVGITPIICAQNSEEIPANTKNYTPEQYYVMYEPEYAISKDGKYTPEPVDRIQAVIADWQKKLAPGTRFLYGGSVNPEIISSYKGLLTTDYRLLSGFVIGSASLDPKTFSSIISALCGLLK